MVKSIEDFQIDNIDRLKQETLKNITNVELRKEITRKFCRQYQMTESYFFGRYQSRRFQLWHQISFVLNFVMIFVLISILENFTKNIELIMGIAAGYIVLSIGGWFVLGLTQGIGYEKVQQMISEKMYP